MSTDNKIIPLETIIPNYDAFIIDLWGVVHDGYAPYENSINMLNKMISSGKHITFLSNSPRPGSLSKEILLGWGINLDDITIYTSGDAVREQLVSWSDDIFKNLGKKFYHLGEDRNTDLLSGLDVDRTEDMQEADFLLISAYIDDDESLDCFDSLLEEAAARKLPVICANPDLIANHGPQVRYCAGTFSAKYKKLGGTVYYYGKPDVRVYNTIINKYSSLGVTDKKKILMIGDTMETDILGANNVGIDSAMAVTGNGRRIYSRLRLGEQDIFHGFEARPTWITSGMKG